LEFRMLQWLAVSSDKRDDSLFSQVTSRVARDETGSVVSSTN
jgi:hypothetical protein